MPLVLEPPKTQDAPSEQTCVHKNTRGFVEYQYGWQSNTSPTQPLHTTQPCPVLYSLPSPLEAACCCHPTCLRPDPTPSFCRSCGSVIRMGEAAVSLRRRFLEGGESPPVLWCPLDRACRSRATSTSRSGQILKQAMGLRTSLRYRGTGIISLGNISEWEKFAPLANSRAHAHTASPKPPDFARGKYRHLP